MDRIDVMRLFIRVADTGNFSKVARASGISQPTVSKLIASLEERLGSQLLHRTPRALNLTGAGREFYDASVEILARLDQAEAQVTQSESSPSGLVRVALSPGFGRTQVVPHLPAFFARHPDITIDFDIAQRPVDLIEAGLDVAIRIGALDDSTMKARRIGAMAYITAASPAYVERFGTPRTPADLTSHRCIGFVARDAIRPWAFKGGVTHLPGGPMRSNDAEYIRAAVLAGIGIGHNAGWLYAKDVADGRLVRLLPDCVPEPFPIHAVWPGSRPPAAKTRVFIEFLAEVFAADPLLKIRD